MPLHRPDFMKSPKRLLREMLYPLGSEATIRFGQLKGCRYVVTEQSGWSPVMGRWEPEAQKIYAHLVMPKEVVWDLGANTGIHTLLFSRLVGPRGTVVAFEPLQVNVQQILRTCALNAVANVTVVAKAVSDSTIPALFHTGRHDKQGSLVGIGSEDGGVIEVPCTTLDAALEETPRVDFVKIDIEGAESRALQGFSRVGAANPTFAIDLHTPEEDVAVGRWLKRNGYRAFRLRDDTARAKGVGGAIVSPIRDLEQGWPHGDGVWGTVIAVHPSRSEKLARLESLATGNAP
jgi:FkbM family methyltransferase